MKIQIKSKKVNQEKTLPGNFGSPFQIVVTALAIFFASQLVAAIIIGIVIAIIKGGATAQSILDSAIAQFFFILLAEAGVVALVFLILKLRGLKLENIGLGRRPKFKDLISAILGFGLFFIVLIAVNALMTVLIPSLDNGQKQDIGFDSLKTSSDYILAFMALALLPPIGEEILVRGYLYSGLRKVWKFLPAMIVTSIFFGLAHLQLGSGTAILWAAGINTFVLSLVLVYLREKSGALYAGMLVHCLNNLLAFLVHFR
jgi:uncharacterized protein